MKFEWYLARRYFKGKRRESRFLSFIKIMAIAGVTIGSAGLLIALSIVHGFKSSINEKIIGFGPHISISSFGEDPIYRSDTLITNLSQYPEISQIQAVKLGQVMLQTGNHITGTLIKGVAPGGGLTDLDKFITEGNYDILRDSAGVPGLIMGATMASSLQAEVGEKVIVYKLEGVPSPINTPDIKQFRVAGIYETGITQFDEMQVIVERQQLDDLLSMPGAHASEIEIKLHRLDEITAFDSKLNTRLEFPYFTETIFERYANIFAWVNLQEQTIPFVISVMIIVAAFNLIGTILMMVLERTKDIGILKTIGATGAMIKKIFILEGLFVAFIGLISGIVISILFNFLQGTYKLIPLSEENYYMAYAPVEPHGIDFIIVSGVTILLCIAAAYFPARVASNTDPVKVIAYGR